MGRPRVLITGGAGFIGANLCRAFRERDIDTVVLDDLSTGSLDNLRGLDVEFQQGSILSRPTLAAAARQMTTIVHLAARPSVPRSLEDPFASHEANATGTLLVLDAARSVGAQVIVASSSSVYGLRHQFPTREDAIPSPISPYAASKLAAEAYCMAYQRCFALPTLVFRFFNVFGPLQAAGHAYAAVVPKFIDAALAGRPLEIHGDGSQTRDFTYVDSVTSVIVAAVERGTNHDGAVNLAFGTRTSVSQLAERIAALVGRPVTVHHVEARRGDVPQSQADNTLLRSLFPELRPTGLDAGLRATVAWHLAARSDLERS